MSNFREITDVSEFSFPVFKSIGKNWGLITAGSENSFNTMTASWGGAGIIWNKNVIFVFVRPSRYTHEFMEKNDKFSFGIMPSEDKKILNLCGSKSGREIDKIKETGLVPIFTGGTVAFEQAQISFICKKLYASPMDKNAIISENDRKNYENGDVHDMYIGEIEKILEKF